MEHAAFCQVFHHTNSSSSIFLKEKEREAIETTEKTSPSPADLFRKAPRKLNRRHSRLGASLPRKNVKNRAVFRRLSRNRRSKLCEFKRFSEKLCRPLHSAAENAAKRTAVHFLCHCPFPDKKRPELPDRPRDDRGAKRKITEKDENIFGNLRTNIRAFLLPQGLTKK